MRLPELAHLIRVFISHFKNASISLWRGFRPFVNYDYKIIYF